MASRFFFLIVLAGFILFFSPSAYAKLVCTNSTNPADGSVMLRLSSKTNAHAELPAQSNYLVEIRCKEDNIAGVTISPGSSVNNTATLINLSGITNAHAEEPGLNNYTTTFAQMTTNSTIGNFYTGVIDNTVTPGATCSSLDDTPVAGLLYTEFVRLSQSTNAHLESPTAAQNYPIRICIAYGEGSGVPSTDIVRIEALDPNSVPSTGLPQNQTAPIVSLGVNGIETRNRVWNNPNFTKVSTLQVAFICNTTDLVCQSISPGSAGYTLVTNEISSFASGNNPTFLLPQTARIINHGHPSPYTSPPPQLYQNLVTAIASYPPASALNQPAYLDGIQSTLDAPYTVDPTAMNLPLANYKFIVIDYAAKFDYSANPQTELSSFLANNFQVLNFSVVAGGGGPGVGAGGDTYVVQSIVFPNLFDTQDISVNITARNRDATNPTTDLADLRVTIRDEQGNPVSIYNNLVFQDAFDFAGASPVESATYSFTIQQAALSPHFLNIGETYTLYATIVPWDDPATIPSPDESITANNSAFRTFTSVEPPQTYAVPDAPWWMSLILVSIVMGWLYVATRGKKGNENEKLPQRHGRFAFHE